MTANEVKQFFDDYVFGFIFSDIEREMAWAKTQFTIMGDLHIKNLTGGGNFLCALGLLCYTEFMGGISTGSFSKGPDKSRFDAFFNLMGPDYEAFNRQINVYKIFRCGMVHEYFIKKSGVIYMLSGGVNIVSTMSGDVGSLGGAPSVLKGPVQYGIGILDDGRYFFIVEQYYKDFAQACHKVYAQLMSSSNQAIPQDVG